MVDMIWNIFVAITSYDEEYHEHLSILRHIQFISYWNYSFSNKQHIIKPKRVDLLTVHVCVLAMRLARTWMQYVTSARGRDDDVAKKMAATTPHTHTDKISHTIRSLREFQSLFIFKFACWEHWRDNEQWICQAFTVMMHAITKSYTNSYKNW